MYICMYVKFCYILIFYKSSTDCNEMESVNAIYKQLDQLKKIKKGKEQTHKKKKNVIKKKRIFLCCNYMADIS